MRDAWPPLPFAAWEPTCSTLHLWTQIVGKLRLATAPMVNHWWQVPFYLTCRGLTTSPMPHGEECVQLDFDLIAHRLEILVSDGRRATLPLTAGSVANFYRDLMDRLRDLGIDIAIRTLPAEMPAGIAFEADVQPRAYDPEWARRFWRVLLRADRLLKAFRGGFLGKASPVHFFWGSFDLAVSRFSGRRAPPHPGGVPHFPDWAAREAYSHEVSSCGFWPGNGGFGRAAFYSYAYPEPAGFAQAAIPAPAFYSSELREFVLPYDEVRELADPDGAVLAFLRLTYVAEAEAGHWDRAALERAAAPA